MGERKKPDYGFGFCRKCGAQYKRGAPTAKYCAPCAKSMRLVYRRSYRAAHREERAAEKRAYWAAHREELVAKKRAYWAAHREEQAAKARARRRISGLLKLMVAADSVRRVMDVQQQQTKG